MMEKLTPRVAIAVFTVIPSSTERARPPDVAEKPSEKFCHIVAEWHFLYLCTIPL
jgi:hypothetical protein